MEERMDRLRVLLAALLTAVALHLFAPSLTVWVGGSGDGSTAYAQGEGNQGDDDCQGDEEGDYCF
jgi:hypothetical protein